MPESGDPGGRSIRYQELHLKPIVPAARAALAVVAVLLATTPASAAEPVSRPLAGIDASRATLKNAATTPAPTINVLDARIGADGRVVATCSSAENPAYRQWRDRMAERGRLPQER
jgi:hypothetical protein